MTYKPNIAIHPGRAIARALKVEKMTQKELSIRTSLTEKHLSQIINGEASVTVETSLLLENVLGGSASFWINLEKNYQETLARIEELSQLKKEIPLLKYFPYLELSRRGCIPQVKDQERRVKNLWQFFGVNSLHVVKEIQSVAYRKRKSQTDKSGHIASWLRCGELDAEDIKTGKYSDQKLKAVLPELRALTLLEPLVYSKKAKNLLAEAGVALVFIKHFEGTGVSGAVRWVGDRPIIQLSLFGSYSDTFWFNLFHEIGHLLLHGKTEKFVEFKKPVVDKKENEANVFASNKLIPLKDYRSYITANNFSKKSIKEFSKYQKIHPGIIEGRLLFESKIKWSHTLGFRIKLKFVD